MSALLLSTFNKFHSSFFFFFRLKIVNWAIIMSWVDLRKIKIIIFYWFVEFGLSTKLVFNQVLCIQAPWQGASSRSHQPVDRYLLIRFEDCLQSLIIWISQQKCVGIFFFFHHFCGRLMVVESVVRVSWNSTGQVADWLPTLRILISSLKSSLDGLLHDKIAIRFLSWMIYLQTNLIFIGNYLQYF